jgi:hypothetical protein
VVAQLKRRPTKGVTLKFSKKHFVACSALNNSTRAHIAAIGLCLSLAVLSACSVSVTDDKNKKPADTTVDVAAVRAEPLSGRLFGQNWTPTRAGIRKVGNDRYQLMITAGTSDVCDVSVAQRSPFVLAGLPNLVLGSEYVTDLSRGIATEAVTFVEPGITTMNVIASSSRLQLQRALTANSYEVGIHAEADLQDNRPSAINGTIEAINCESNVPFTRWSSYIGSYDILSLDGRMLTDSERQLAEVRLRSIRLGSGQDLRMVEFPLLEAYGPSMSVINNKGPIEGKGISRREGSGAAERLIYEYDGELMDGGVARRVQFYMDLIELPGRQLEIQHRFHVVGSASPATTHRIVLRRY